MNDIAISQAKLMQLLQDLILRYTKGESTSVTVETTQELLTSILYTIDFYLAAAEISEIDYSKLDEYYYSGLGQLRLFVVETKKLYQKIKKEKLKIDLEAYNATIDEGIPSFFEKYNLLFSAHNSMASIDYPLTFDDMNVKGILYINNYLKHLNLETEFCRCFSEEDINDTLADFGKKCRLNHEIELINVFELVINNSIFSVLHGNDTRNIKISKVQFDKFCRLNLSNYSTLIDEAVCKIILELKIANASLIDYIKAYSKEFKSRVSNALKNNSLDSLVIYHDVYKKYNIAFNSSEKLDTQKFNLMIDSILDLKSEDKISFINSKVHSLEDFIDVLNSDCLFADEYLLLFNSLSDIELTLLSKIVFYEEIRDTPECLINTQMLSKKHEDIEWKKYFTAFIKSLDLAKRSNISELCDKIDYEELKFYY